MTPAQRNARNEAYHLLTIAARILGDAGFDDHCGCVGLIIDNMRADAYRDADRKMAKRMSAK